MNETRTDTKWDISFSDNSHIFGIPIHLIESIDASMKVPVLMEGNCSLNLLRVGEKGVIFLERGAIKFHLKYK